MSQSLNTQISAPLASARARLFATTGSHARSGDVRAARLTTQERIAFFRSPEFRDWVAYEKSFGKQVFWLLDVDKTQAAGDVFTFFYKWRCDNNKFSPRQIEVIERFLLKQQARLRSIGVRATRLAWSLPSLVGCQPELPRFARLSPYDVLRLWESKEAGGSGIGLFDFWSNVYWPSQACMTRAQKIAQVNDFAPHYACRIYPGVKEQNTALSEAGVEPVIVTNGDQELAVAVAPLLGIKAQNVVGSHMIYEGEHATGENHSYEVFAEEWASRPQPGKPLSFHYWMHVNRGRWGWEDLDEEQIVIAGRDGDSASSDGGMMIFLPTPAIGNFMIDTPGEPERLKKFQSVASKYGWSKGRYFTVAHSASSRGWKP